MLEISRSSNAYLLVPIDPLDELGAPADPSELDVELGFSASARLTPEQWHTGDWQVDDSEPTVRYFARILHGPDAPAPVQLDEGEW